MLGSRSNSFSGAPHLSYARYTDVAVEMYRGVETTPATGRNRVYAATLSGPASGGAGTFEGLVLTLVRPKQVHLPLEIDETAKVVLAFSELARPSRDGARVSFGDRAVVKFATVAEAASFCAEASGSSAKRAALPDLRSPVVQEYVAALLLDPDFDKFVADVGDFCARFRETVPAAAVPFAGGAPVASGYSP